jgi:hypothetical protein
MMRNILYLLLLGTASVWGSPEADAGTETLHEDRGYYGYSNTIRVHSGGSIQKALNKAHRGARIIVEAGTYAEQITIRTDGISLIGKGAVLVPPEKPAKNPCSGFAGPNTQAGICVAGKGLKLSDFKVEHKKVLAVHEPVRDVSITGFKVQGFVGFNILVLGAENAYVHDNELTDGGVYGFLTAGSTNTKVSDNKITSTQTAFIGLCMDNFAYVKVTGNTIDNYYIGLCIQTNGAEIEDNHVSHACFGAFLDPGVRDVHLCRNKFTTAIAQCGKLGAGGIVLDGSVKAHIEDNFVSGWKSDGPSAGISIVDDECKANPPSLSCLLRGNKKAVATGNLVKGNVLRDNALDIFKQTNGKGNEVRWNKCKTSSPAKLCAAHRG